MAGAQPDRPLRIVRVTHDYWPATGGNESWNATLDTWFSQTAGDHLTTLVLRRSEEFFDPTRPVQTRAITVPGMTHEIHEMDFYQTRNKADRIRQYVRLIGPWMTRNVDAVQTQIAQYCSVPAWGTRPLILEPEAIIACEYGRHATCPRASAWSCSRCAPLSRPLDWVKGELRLAILARAAVVAQNASVCDDVRRAGMGHKAFELRHIVRTSNFDRDRDLTLGLWARLDALRARCETVVMQVNRMVPFKNPMRLLQLFADDPRVGIVLAGDGPDLDDLRRVAAATPGLSERVLFTGRVPNRQIGPLLAAADATLLTSTISNHNTSLFEALHLSGGPVFATDVGDFPDALRPGVELAALPGDDTEARAAVHALVQTPAAEAMVHAARAYVARFHGFDQLWAYRARIGAAASVPAGPVP